MANAWAFSALWVGLAFVAKLLAIGFIASNALPAKPVDGAVAELIRGILTGAGKLRSSKQRNQNPCSTGLTLQLNSKTGRCAIADRRFAMPRIFGIIAFFQLAA